MRENHARGKQVKDKIVRDNQVNNKQIQDKIRKEIQRKKGETHPMVKQTERQKISNKKVTKWNKVIGKKVSHKNISGKQVTDEY